MLKRELKVLKTKKSKKQSRCSDESGINNEVVSEHFEEKRIHIAPQIKNTNYICWCLMGSIWETVASRGGSVRNAKPKDNLNRLGLIRKCH